MNGSFGWIKERLGQAVGKVMFVRNIAPLSAPEPLFRVVASYYYDFTETEVTILHGDNEKKFPLPLDNPLYFRGATQVHVIDYDTETRMSFSKAVVLGLIPEEFAQAVKTRQLRELNREKAKREGVSIWMVLGVVVLAVGCVGAGVFLGYYLTSTGALGVLHTAVNNATASVLPTPITVG